MRLVELTQRQTSDGIIFTWTCPRCGHVVADMSGATVNQRRANTALAIRRHVCDTAGPS